MSFFAQVTIEDFSRGFRNATRSSESPVLPGVIIIVSVAVASCLVWLLVGHLRDKKKPLALFHDLCGLHNLGRRTEKELLHLARTHGVPDPAFLFVCPDLFHEIKSLEVSRAKNEKERERLKGFFEGFAGAVLT